MLRTVLLLGFAGGIGLVVFNWATSDPDPTTSSETRIKASSKIEKQPRIEEIEKPAEARRPAETRQTPATAFRIKRGARQIEPIIIISDARIGLVEYPDVASQRAGKIVVLGTELPAGTPFDPQRMTKYQLNFLALETNDDELRKLNAQAEDVKRKLAMAPGDLELRKLYAQRSREAQGYQIPGKAQKWRLYRENDNIEPGKIDVIAEEKIFLKLKEGMFVEEGQLLALIDPQTSVDELHNKIAKLDMSHAEVRTAEKTKEETKVRYDIEGALIAKGGGSQEELRAKLLMWNRSIFEEHGKRAGHVVAQREIKQMNTLLKLHEVRAPVSGMVRRLHKQFGETVREQQDNLVLRIENLDRLQIEGFVEVQEARRLAEGMPVIAEPTRPEAPAVVLRGHREPVTAVAVSRGPVPLVLAAGEDRTVRVWEMKRAKDARDKEHWTGEEAWVLYHPSVIRSLACSPLKAERNVCLAGSADGVGLLWNLDQLEKKPLQLQESHRGPILAAVISADGALCATGGDDRAICVWNTATGELVQRLSNAHRGPVTSLAFTPAGDLVSAGRDNRMAVWSVKEGKVTQARDIEARAGQVDRLGVSPDGTQVLFDQGSQLRVLALDDWTIRGVLRNPSASASFTAFALFSPDGGMVLTAAGENRLQLWTNPAGGKQRRATELRQYVWNEGASTCATFDPQGKFAVTGTRDRNVLVWALPDEVKEPEANAVIRRIDPVLDSSSRQVRIVVDVTKKTDRLVPGDKTSLVIYPK